MLRDLVERHLAETESPVAARLLDDWVRSAAEFTKVLPRDYAAITALRDDAARRGDDPDSETTWEKILEVTRG